MSVEHITYQKKKLPIKIGYKALKRVQQEHSQNMTDLENDLTSYEPLLYYSLMQGHKLEGLDFPFKMEDMEDILDDCFFEFSEKLANFFPPEFLEKLMGKVEGNKNEK